MFRKLLANAAFLAVILVAGAYGAVAATGPAPAAPSAKPAFALPTAAGTVNAAPQIRLAQNTRRHHHRPGNGHNRHKPGRGVGAAIAVGVAIALGAAAANADNRRCKRVRLNCEDLFGRPSPRYRRCTRRRDCTPRP